MTKLYNEIKTLTLEDALPVLARVSPADLKKEFWELSQLKDTIVAVGGRVAAEAHGKLTEASPKVKRAPKKKASK